MHQSKSYKPHIFYLIFPLDVITNSKNACPGRSGIVPLTGALVSSRGADQPRARMRCRLTGIASIGGFPWRLGR